ncbi:MAG: WYL domain-containing protein [Bacteroidetes bacterium]|nr:WYL domain-containing protein [Bacteroidota bacterium]
MGTFEERKMPLKIRAINDTMKYANEECKRQIDLLNQSKSLCSCSICKSNQHVRCTGSNKGNRKFICESPEHDRPVNFSSTTSYEAIEIYRNTMTLNLCLLAHTNSTIEGTVLYNETSKYFVEFAHEALFDFIKQEGYQGTIDIDKDTDLVLIFFDLSGSKLSKKKAIIMAKVGSKVIFEIVSHSNHLSSYLMISSIKDKLDIAENTKVVFITDGEICFVDTIRHFFPDAIHIRQFHKKSCRGIIYVHFRQDENDYTLRCLWGDVLDEGTPSTDVIKQREFKANKRINNKERKKKIKYSELSKDIILWEGTVKNPRGARRVLNNKTSAEKTERTNDLKKTKENAKKKNTSTCDTPKPIFRGTLEEAKEIDIIQYPLHMLKKVFGGLYITSNIIETIFNVKAKLSPHRTMKFGNRILVCVLYCHLNLKNKKKEELMKFFKDNVITYEFIMKNVLYGSGKQKNKPVEPSFIDRINEAILKSKELVIHYCDRFKNHTSRIVKPTRIVKNEYNNTTKIEAFCKLRNEKRTFYLERIRDVTIYDPRPIMF